MKQNAFPSPARRLSWRQLVAAAFKISRRDLRGGLNGLWVFVTTVALGVAIMAAAGALSAALREGFARQGRMILGGDVALSRMHLRASPQERAWFASEAREGRVSETVTLRAMARRTDGGGETLVELKAVDGAYPLAGEARLADGLNLKEVLRAGPAVAAEPLLLERLNLKPGDRIMLGSLEVPVRAVLLEEPDKLLDRLTYGARVLVSLETLEKTGLLQPGALVRWRYAFDLKAPTENMAEAFAAFEQRLKAALPEAGFTSHGRQDPAPEITRTLDRLGQFLTLAGLAALAIGGTGIANAVAVYMAAKRTTIATLKSLGASNALIFWVYLTGLLLTAAAGTAIGLVAGGLTPAIAEALYGPELPVRLPGVFPLAALLPAALYGLLIALVFMLWPLARATAVRPAVLFRDEVAPAAFMPGRLVLAAIAAALLLVAGGAILASDAPPLAASFTAGIAAVLFFFLLAGHALTWGARQLPRFAIPELALAAGSLGAPGGRTRQVTLSLGAGLTLLVTVALVDSSLRHEIEEHIPAEAPDYFLLDVPKGETAKLAATLRRIVPDTAIATAPMLRGRIVRLRGAPVEEIKAPPDAEWALSGDRGLTYADTLPEGSELVAGTWWEKDYRGEPLVSFEAGIAQRLGLSLGDEVTVNVLGRNITARIASLRKVDWESLTINFVMVFSPNALAAAPHNLLAKVAFPPGTPLVRDAAAARALAAAFPTVSLIRVKEAIAAANKLFAKAMIAVQVAGGLTVLSGAIVLAGALGTVQRRRLLEAAILKALGANRLRILAAHFVEYLSLALFTALAALAAGGLLAWIVLRLNLDVPLVWTWSAVGLAPGLALVLTALFGGIGTWRTLRAPAARLLRTE